MSDLGPTRAFFGPRAAGWEDRFAEDQPRYDAAVARLGLRFGDRAVDLGCGTGRALLPLRALVGSGGAVVGIDAVPEMLDEARRLGRHEVAALVLGDARRPPLRPGSVDGLVAAGLLPHLDDLVSAAECWADATRPGGRLLVFHPLSRAGLAARHGHAPRDDSAIAPQRLVPTLRAARWRVDEVQDRDDLPFVLLATRVGQPS